MQTFSVTNLYVPAVSSVMFAIANCNTMQTFPCEKSAYKPFLMFYVRFISVMEIGLFLRLCHAWHGIWVAGWWRGTILVVLVLLSYTLPVEEVADMHARWIFALIFELNNLFLKKLLGKKKTATQCDVVVFCCHMSLFENKKRYSGYGHR